MADRDVCGWLSFHVEKGKEGSFFETDAARMPQG